MRCLGWELKKIFSMPMLWIFLAGMLAGLILSGSYKHFVTDRIMDWGGMENPDAYRAEETLTRFSWKQ